MKVRAPRRFRFAQRVVFGLVLRIASAGLLGAGLIGGWACSGDRASAWTGTVETQPDGARLVRNRGDGLWTADREASWVLEEELRIGTVEGTGPDAFGNVGGVFVDGPGRIHVVESQAREIRVFDVNGAPIRILGGEGEGPGEFRFIAGMAWDNTGTMWVVDFLNGRYTRYDTVGVVVGTARRESRFMRIGPFRGGITPEGVLYDTDLHVPAGSDHLPPLMLAAGMGGSRLILRAMLSLDGAPVSDTVELPVTSTEPVTFRTEGAMIGSPYNTSVHWTFDPRGSLWVGQSDAYRIEQHTLDGVRRLVIDRDYSPVPVTADEVDAWVQSDGAARFRERGGRIDASQLQDVKPIFDGFVVDDTGYLWVRLGSRADAVRFDVFDPEGRYLGVVEGVTGMVRLAPVIRGDRFYAVLRDSLDVPYVVRYRIRGRD